MLDSINTIVIFGATGGIGEALARRFHAMGKKVIATGRRAARLAELKKELAGLETYVMDNSEVAALGKHANVLLDLYPTIDTVWVNSGLMAQGNLKSLATYTDDKIIYELNTNTAAPIILARHFLPHLLSLNVPANFIVTSSGLAFVPMGTLFPAYHATKAAVHAFMVGLRQNVKGTNVSVIEIVPPYVRTELDAHNRLDKVTQVQPMELDDYITQTLELMKTKGLKEVGVGDSAALVGAWRQTFGPILEAMHVAD